MEKQAEGEKEKREKERKQRKVGKVGRKGKEQLEEQNKNKESDFQKVNKIIHYCFIITLTFEIIFLLFLNLFYGKNGKASIKY